MREIKFRAWDAELGDWQHYMEPPKNNGHDMTSVSCAHLNAWFSDRQKERVVFMQFTGLKDKNGVEIYEGDLLRCDDVHDETPQEVMFLNGEYTVRSVPANDDWTQLRVIVFGGMDRDGTEYDGGCEIIGNIYENPELVK